MAISFYDKKFNTYLSSECICGLDGSRNKVVSASSKDDRLLMSIIASCRDFNSVIKELRDKAEVFNRAVEKESDANILYRFR